MATNTAPSVKHRVVGFDTEGKQRIVPAPNGTQWSAEAEARSRMKRGFTGVEVQSWDSKLGQFTFNSVANNHLITQDKKAQVSEDAIEALGRLASSQRAMYKAASSGKLTQDEIEEFIVELKELAALLEGSNEPSYR